MSVAAATQAIQLILAPVVMVTACAILVGGILTHYQAVNDRVRALNAERYQIARGFGGTQSPDPLTEERLAQIDHQLRDLLRRLRLLHASVVTTYAAIALFIACMIAIAAAVLVNAESPAAGVIGLFLLGTLVLLAGVLTAGIELTRSLKAVVWETERIEAVATRRSGVDRAER
jgi:hypothetical protein